MARRRALQAGLLAEDPPPVVVERPEPAVTDFRPRHAAPARPEPAIPWIAAPQPRILPVPPQTIRRSRGFSRLRRMTIRRLLWALLVLVSAALAGTALVAPPDLRSGNVAAAAVSQRVLAIVLTKGAQITGVSLLAASPGQAQQVLAPSGLLLDVPGAGRMPLAQALAVGRDSPAIALGDALGVKIAATWVLSGTDLRALIDRVGGIEVTIDTEVLATDDPGSEIVLTRGTQRLTGAQGLRYGGYFAANEPEVARLARQERVLRAVLSRLPAAAQARRQVLESLADGPSGTALAVANEITGQAQVAGAAGQLASVVLPVRAIEVGGQTTSYGLDEQAAATMTRERLAAVRITAPSAGRLRVLVSNGVGTPGLGEAARARLVAAGLSYRGGGNVPGFGVPQTVVLIPDASLRARASGLAVAQALGLGQGALRLAAATPTTADVMVLLGRDFRPT